MDAGLGLVVQSLRSQYVITLKVLIHKKHQLDFVILDSDEL